MDLVDSTPPNTRVLNLQKSREKSVFLNGGGGIRTPGTLSRPTVFKTVAFSHSATPPCLFYKDLRRIADLASHDDNRIQGIMPSRTTDAIATRGALMRTPRPRTRPKKPYPTFPLTPHPNGQWCKKMRGRLCFFGIWANPDAALERYLLQAADLHAGRASSVATTETSVKKLANHYLSHQADQLATGKIDARWFGDCRCTLTEFARVVGEDRAVVDLRPSDFQTYRTHLATRLGVHALSRSITVIKGMFKYGTDTGLLANRPLKKSWIQAAARGIAFAVKTRSKRVCNGSA